MTCVYCGEPGTHTDGDNWYCQTCWNESQANPADRRIREAEQRVVEAAEQRSSGCCYAQQDIVCFYVRNSVSHRTELCGSCRNRRGMECICPDRHAALAVLKEARG